MLTTEWIYAEHKCDPGIRVNRQVTPSSSSQSVRKTRYNEVSKLEAAKGQMVTAIKLYFFVPRYRAAMRGATQNATLNLISGTAAKSDLGLNAGSKIS
jgi:hypothetical protein